MIDMRDPRGIITFIVRYLMLQVGLLVLLVLSLSSSLVLLTFICLMGFFTFFQVLASISRDFLDHVGLWKAIVIAAAVLTDVPILWWFGRLVAGIAGSGSDWWLVTSWMPFHFFAAFFAWGLREMIYMPGAQNTAVSSAPVSAVDPGGSENPSDPEEEASAPTSTSANTEADTKSTKDEADTHKSDDDNSGAESDNSTVTDKNGEESQEIKSEEGTDETKRNPHSGDADHNWGTYVDEDGIPHIDPSDPRLYLNPKNRPSYRKGIVDKVREAFTDADGVLRDSRGKPIDWQPGQPRKGIWDMGHRHGKKYHEWWLHYINGEMTTAEFRDWYNNR